MTSSPPLASPPPRTIPAAAGVPMDGASASELASTTVVFIPGVENRNEVVFRLGMTGPVVFGHDDRKDAGYVGSFLGYVRHCFCSEIFRGTVPGPPVPPRDYIRQRTCLIADSRQVAAPHILATRYSNTQPSRED